MLIVLRAIEGETILPENATPSSLENENSPLLTGSGGENVRVVEVPHATIARPSF